MMGLLALTTFSATYLLYWAKPGSVCIPTTTGSTDKTLSWQQILFGVLPFVVFPLTLILSGLARGAENNRHALGLVASLCLSEIMFALILGGGMTICMGATSVTTVGIVIFGLAFLMVVGWAVIFKYPRVMTLTPLLFVDSFI